MPFTRGLQKQVSAFIFENVWTFLTFAYCRFLMKSTMSGFWIMVELCWQCCTQPHRSDTCGRCSYCSILADVIITVGRTCRCWSCSVVGNYRGIILFSWVWWILWILLMFWNADGQSLPDCCIKTAASELSESFPIEECLCTRGQIWWFECFYVNEKYSRVEIWACECPHKLLILLELCNSIHFDVPVHYSPVRSD